MASTPTGTRGDQQQSKERNQTQKSQPNHAGCGETGIGTGEGGRERGRDVQERVQIAGGMTSDYSASAAATVSEEPHQQKHAPKTKDLGPQAGRDSRETGKGERDVQDHAAALYAATAAYLVASRIGSGSVRAIATASGTCVRFAFSGSGLPRMGNLTRAASKDAYDAPVPIDDDTTAQLKVKTLTSEILTFPYDANMTIGGLKAEIYDEVGIEPDKQGLVFNREQLVDGRSLTHYNIKPGSVVHMAPHNLLHPL